MVRGALGDWGLLGGTAAGAQGPKRKWASKEDEAPRRALLFRVPSGGSSWDW
jgi:hypothetical protein